MSKGQTVIVELLTANGGWMYGLELVKASGGRLGRGVVYVMLEELVKLGVIESKQEPPERTDPRIGITRYLYRLKASKP